MENKEVEEKYYYCEDCKCMVGDLNRPDPIDYINIVAHGCAKCKKLVPADFDCAHFHSGSSN